MAIVDSGEIGGVIERIGCSFEHLRTGKLAHDAVDEMIVTNSMKGRQYIVSFERQKQLELEPQLPPQ